MIPRFPPQGNWGRKVTRNGGPQFGACLILSELGTQTLPNSFETDLGKVFFCQVVQW